MGACMHVLMHACTHPAVNKKKPLTLLVQEVTLLDEATERGQAGTRADHDDRGTGFEGQAELRLANVDGHAGLVAVVWLLALQPGGGHPLCQATSASCVLHHHRCDADGVWLHLNTDSLFIMIGIVYLQTHKRKNRISMLCVIKRMHTPFWSGDQCVWCTPPPPPL